MKFYVFVLSVACFTVISCKKDRTCTCSIATNGSNATHTQTAGTSFAIPGLPPIVIVAASDTTVITPYNFSTTQKTSYDEVSKNTMRKNCPVTHEENFSDQSMILSPGTSTISNVKTEKRVYTCKVE